MFKQHNILYSINSMFPMLHYFEYLPNLINLRWFYELYHFSQDLWSQRFIVVDINDYAVDLSKRYLTL